MAKHWTKKPGTVMAWVQVPSVVRDLISDHSSVFQTAADVQWNVSILALEHKEKYDGVHPSWHYKKTR